MKNLITIIFSLVISLVGYCQTPVTDNSNTGQLKRMVFEQWDDWQPDPGTHFFGIIPNNILGFFWWKIVNRNYYYGEDLRPYTPTGPFAQNTLSLAVQKDIDLDISDTSEGINDTHLATYSNMAGGVFDLPYEIYFKKQFDKLASAGLDFVKELANKNPKAYQRLIVSKVYTDYIERLDIQTSRISMIHESFVDKGARVLAYMEIKKQMEFQNQVLGHYVKNYLPAMTIPDTREIKSFIENRPNGFVNNDASIVEQILKTFKF